MNDNGDFAITIELKHLAERLDYLSARLTRLEALAEKIAIIMGIDPHG